MGTFANLFGEMKIPEEKREEFSKRVQTIFEKGGLMDISYVQIYDVVLYVLKPTQFDENGKLHALYSYFEQSIWEDCGYDSKNNKFYSDKVGYSEFCKVICAINVLYEFYTEDFSMANINGRAFNALDEIAWINYLFDEKYTNKRIEYPFELYRILLKSNYRGYIDKILKPILYACNNFCQSDAYRAVSDFKDFEKLISENKNYIFEKNAWDKLTNYFNSDTISREKKLEKLKSMYLLPKYIKNFHNEDEEDVYISIIVTPIVCMKFICELFQLDFWEFYEEIYSKNPDFLIKGLDKEEKHNKPISPMSTKDFFGCSYDDMIYFWTKDNDIEFSNELENFISELKREYDNILNTKDIIIEQEQIVKELIFSLKDANIISRTGTDKYVVCPTESMFYEFLNNTNKREVQAFIYLLSELNQKYAKKDKTERKELSQYIWILSNPELRKLKFGY